MARTPATPAVSLVTTSSSSDDSVVNYNNTYNTYKRVHFASRPTMHTYSLYSDTSSEPDRHRMRTPSPTWSASSDDDDDTDTLADVLNDYDTLEDIVKTPSSTTGSAFPPSIAHPESTLIGSGKLPSVGATPVVGTKPKSAVAAFRYALGRGFRQRFTYAPPAAATTTPAPRPRANSFSYFYSLLPFPRFVDRKEDRIGK